MKVEDLNVLVRIQNNTISILKFGSYRSCVETKNQDSITELILKVGDTVNTNIIG